MQQKKSVISRRIKELRKSRKESQQDLADVLYLSKQSVSKIEQDKINLTLENAIGLANHYNVSIDWISGRIEEKNNPTEMLDILSKYIRYTSRNPIEFEEKRLKDDDPPVSLKINAALHKYLISVVKAENMLKYDDLDNARDIYEGYIKSIKQTFGDDMKVLDWAPEIPLVERENLKNTHDSDHPVWEP